MARDAVALGEPNFMHSFTAALPVPLVLPLVAGFALVVKSMIGGERFSVAALFAVLATGLLVGFVARKHARLPRAGILAACHAFAWTPFFAIASSQLTSDPIVANVAGMRCGTGIMGLIALGAPVGGFALLVLGAGAGYGLFKRAGDRAITGLAAGATVLALAAFGFALTRLGRPDPDTYLASLGAPREIRFGEKLVLRQAELEYKRIYVEDESPPNTPPYPWNGDCVLSGIERSGFGSDDVCPALRVRLDPRGDVAVLESSRQGGPWAVEGALRLDTGARTTISAVTHSDRIAPPIGWIVGAGLGSAMAVALMILARRLRREAALLEGRQGHHAGGGVVNLAGGESVRVDAAEALPLGPVVLTGAVEPTASYRQTAAPTFDGAIAGTLTAVRAARTDLAASLDAVALAAVGLGATPLIVARVLASFQ